MKKVTVFVLLALLLLSGCRKNNEINENKTENIDIAGKVFVYEKGLDGNMANSFLIVLNKDGTLEYSESKMLSITHHGKWELKNDVLVLTENFNGETRINYFKAENEKLTFIEENSSNFSFTKLSDGDRFFEDEHKKNQVPVQKSYVRKINTGSIVQAKELSQEDEENLLKILENDKWVEDLDQCIMDYEIFLKGNTYFYHSECGTFSKFNISKTSTMSKDEPENAENIFIADENTKDKVNSMLKKYN